MEVVWLLAAGVVIEWVFQIITRIDTKCSLLLIFFNLTIWIICFLADIDIRCLLRQLRNLVWATSKHDVYLMSHFSVIHWSSLTCNMSEVLNVSGHVAPCEVNVSHHMFGYDRLSSIVFFFVFSAISFLFSVWIMFFYGMTHFIFSIKSNLSTFHI